MLNIRFLLALSCLLSISSVQNAVAQSSSQCIQQCLAQASAQSGCSGSDSSCICQDSNLDAANSCVMSSCPEEESQALALVPSICPNTGDASDDSTGASEGNAVGAGSAKQPPPPHNPNAPDLSNSGRANTAPALLIVSATFLCTTLFL